MTLKNSPIKYTLTVALIICITIIFNSTTIADWTTESPTWTNTSLENTTLNWDDSASNISIEGYYSDEFNTGSLDTDRWWWVREQPANWTMGDTYVQINGTPTDMYEGTATAPLLLQNFSNENLTIITKVSATPDTGYEGGGPAFYADDDNFVIMIYYYQLSSNYILLKMEDDNSQVYTISDEIVSDPIYLKLQKNGTDYSGYYSTDRSSWTLVHTYSIADTMTDIGLTACNSITDNPEPFLFDYFITTNFTEPGNVTSWYNAGTNNISTSVTINATNVTNTDYEVIYRQNNTGSFTSALSGINRGNDKYEYTFTTPYQNTDIRLILSGNNTATPYIVSITFNSEPDSPENPQNIQNTTWHYGSNFTWDTSPDADSWRIMIYEE